MKDTDLCCGAGGSLPRKFESIAVNLGEEKIRNAEATQAEYIISTDLSCLMHLDGYIKNKGYSIKTMHLADVLVSGW